MTNINFFSLGLQHGRLSHYYQPVRLPAPLDLQQASPREQTEFWEGWTTGWDEQEASSVIFFKVEA
jgi:hypothetical protein